MDEEVVLLEEQLAAAHADIERLQARLTEVEAALTGREAELATVNEQLDESRRAVSERDIEVESLRGGLEGAEQRARAAAQRYREAVLAQTPEMPAELIAGDTVEAIDESLAAARQTVAQVRQHLEQQAQALRVPPGAPVRSGPDMSALSSAEKIRLGLSQT
jgi:chromosome segregation ATPase